MVCEGSARVALEVCELWLEIAPPKQEEEMVSWDVVRKEYIRKIGPNRGKTKQEMQGALRKIVKSKEAFQAALRAGAAASSSSRH